MKKALGLETGDWRGLHFIALLNSSGWSGTELSGGELELVIVLTHREPCEVVQYAGP